ncbi:MAG: SGNH/GDSL hydrolase family protein [Candidatus Didemnitutus sp.]|nr:SGNH/GDSL hydrolase family protein [Candidatus Didemnitutus sp.]
MSALAKSRRLALWLFVGCVLWPFAVATHAEPRWIGTWATAPIPERPGQDTPTLAAATFRQNIHISLGGRTVRLRLSNAFGATPLRLAGVHLALAAPGGAIQPGTDRAVKFAGQDAVTIPAGAPLVSDPLDFPLPPQADVSISIHFAAELPDTLTAHPGSRTTSFLQPGDALATVTLPDARKVERWYFINGLDVLVDAPATSALAILGDSITDGRGTTTDANNRWPDEFVRRYQAQPGLPPLGVLNLGIGGNALVRGGIGPNILARFDRDVLAQSGVRWLLVFAGINDLGGRVSARKEHREFASISDLVAGYQQVITRAHSRNLRVVGATITPYQGADFYWTPDGEADRQKINEWIRHSGAFDAVADFDVAVRDPERPTRLRPEFDSGDHLHLSPAGYARLGEALAPNLFSP